MKKVALSHRLYEAGIKVVEGTRSMAPICLVRSQDYIEFACLAEAAIAADEYNAWARTRTVEEYLQQWSSFTDGPVTRHDKLLEYWGT